MVKIKALDLEIEKPPAPKSKPPPLVLDRRKSADETATSPSVKLDALNKGITNDIKGMFEENIAIKKGLAPDPNLPQGSVVKMRRKVNPNIKHLQNNAFGRLENEDQSNNKKRESIPIDKKMFNQFMNKFEDDHSRKAAKAQLLQITQKSKGYKTSWSKKQEEKKLEEERIVMEEIARQEEEEARIKAEEEENLRREEEERQRQIQ